MKKIDVGHSDFRCRDCQHVDKNVDVTDDRGEPRNVRCSKCGAIADPISQIYFDRMKLARDQQH
jgi:hypothetical protein